jgi:hypothetical protein
MTTISKEEAVAKGMKPLTIAAHAEDPFLHRVIADMKRVQGTEWALVQYRQGGDIEVWRVPLEPNKEGPLERLSSKVN